MDFKLTKKNMILIAVFVLLVVVFSLIYNIRYPSKNVELNKKTLLVSDYSRFFTISNCANSYINYLAKKDAKSLELLLSASYKEQKNITENNILSQLKPLSQDNYDFVARKMYQENLSSSLVKYYIYGELTAVEMDEYVRPTDYYLIIIMDTKNFTYSVIPDDGPLFKGVES